MATLIPLAPTDATAKVRQPADAPTRRRDRRRLAGAALLVAALSACGDDAANPVTAPAAPATTITTAAVVDVPLVVFDVVCDTQPVRMDADAERFTTESWECGTDDDSARIDFFESPAQQAEALDVVRGFMGSSDDGPALSELPLVCGDGFGVGVGFNETRDRLIAELEAAGVATASCD